MALLIPPGPVRLFLAKVVGLLLSLLLVLAAARAAHPAKDKRPARADEPPPTPASKRASPGQTTPASPRSPIGYNLDYPGDWTLLRPFIDLMHNARPWTGACADADPHCDGHRHLVLDAQGWPRTLQYRDNPRLSYDHASSVFSTIPGGAEVGRVFVVTWEGEGAIEIFNGDVLSTDLAKRRLTFKFLGGNTIVRIRRTDPQGNGHYVRNLRIFRADFEPLLQQGEIFNPEMLAFLEPFGTLRFMDWMLANDPEERPARWSERPRPDHFPWIRPPLDPAAPCDTDASVACRRIGGYPVEVMVALANRLGANPHFNMPYRADDEWVSQFAAYVRDHLAKNLRATVEWSNEVWNWGFPQATYARLEANKLWRSEGSGWLQFMGARAARTCRLWKAAFAGQEARVRCVIAPQTAWVEAADKSLDCPAWVARDKSHRPCHAGVDAVAISGYFGTDLQNRANDKVLQAWLRQGEARARDLAFRYLEKGESGGLLDEESHPLGDKPGASAVGAIALFKRWQAIAHARGMELYVYEGGTHFGREGGDLKVFLANLVKDERMVGLYRRVLDEYRHAGGTVWNAWGGLGPGDAWCNADSLTDRRHPKYRALVDFAKANPCWWPGCAPAAK
jgi:hypothetical protein